MSRQSRVAAELILCDPRWAAVLSRDARFDGQFVYAVTTTGVYCRPSCAARRPRPENVQFHPSATEAEAAGFRPCLRCQPGAPSRDESRAVLIAELCRWIDSVEVAPDLAALAARAQVSRYHLHRIFKAVTGVTPKAYALAQRARNIREALPNARSITDAIYQAGYNANSRFYAQSQQLLGMTPSDYRSGGAEMIIRFAIGECALGAILVAASERGICAISLGDDPAVLLHALQDRFGHARLLGADPAFEQWVAQVIGFVEAPQLGLTLPLDVRGTAFQLRVWQALRDIPPGDTASYAEIARRIGSPKACRAVAQACAANVLAVAIPCHRVIRNDGALSGYRWGVERKRQLLEQEAVLSHLPGQPSALPLS